MGSPSSRGMAVMEGEGAREQAAPTYGVGSSNGFHQSFLLLYLGCGLGWDVLEDQCVRCLSGLALAEWSRMGEEAVVESRDQV